MGGLSALFINRPVATTLLTLGIALAGLMAVFLLPISPLPEVDFPVILVQAGMPGASPETMATSVATPLERHLSQVAAVNEMTSTSSVGNTRITLQFDLDRDIDGAARDVQAAINAARADLPVSLKSNPTYRKVNPADAPIMLLAMSSPTIGMGKLYDLAATILQPRISQVPGVGQVNLGGSSLPAVRVELNPNALFKYGISLEDVRSALMATNANIPKGAIEQDGQRFQIYTNDQAAAAAVYQPLIIAWRNQTPVRLSDLAEVSDSVEDIRNTGLFNGHRAVLLTISRQPNANVLETVRRVREILPELQAAIPTDITLIEGMDRTQNIRASVMEVGKTLVVALLLVILTVFLFLRDGRATLIPAVAVPVSLIGTFGAMYLLGFSLNTFSLMALTVGTGFVVDDAIVVLENTIRHMETGMPRRQAALLGAKEVGFTVVAMSLSLVAVFIPILLMGGIVGRLFREFAVTLSVAVMISLVVSLTTTPMLCSRLLRESMTHTHGRFYRTGERVFNVLRDTYAASLRRVLRHPLLTMGVLLATICFNFYLYGAVSKGFFPQQDTGRLVGVVVADQSISFQLMQQKMKDLMEIIRRDPAVANSAGFTGGGQTNSGFVFVGLKPLAERNVSADQILGRLRPQLAKVAGATLYLQSAQDVRAGGRMGSAQYQYTLQTDRLSELEHWTPILTSALQKEAGLVDVSSDMQIKGLETNLVIDRDAAARLGLSALQIDNTLYDAFGQRQVSVIYNAQNQYHVVMEVAPQFWQSPLALSNLYVSTAKGSAVTSGPLGTVSSTNGPQGNAVSGKTETMIPLAAFSHFEEGVTPLSVNHQGHFAASTLTFNLPPGKALSDAIAVIEQNMIAVGAPANLQGSFQGTAKFFQDSMRNQPVLIVAALATVYIVLGILYESLVHPITILSTLPSAGVGALLALMALDSEFSLIALIGVFLLIGIVKKNAIMMIDFAVQTQRQHDLSPEQAIFDACVMRFRPIMMTTMVALFGALPLILSHGDGAEIRQPLGITIVGGLVVSQVLTLYTTPVVYLYLDRLSRWWRCVRKVEL